MNPLYLLAAIGAFLVLSKPKAGGGGALPGATGTPPSSQTLAGGFPQGQPMPPVLAPPGATGNQIGVALAQNSGTIANAFAGAVVSIFDWARASDPATSATPTAADPATAPAIALALADGNDATMMAV